MFIHCLWFIDQPWKTLFKPFKIKICKVICSNSYMQCPENRTFMFVLIFIIFAEFICTVQCDCTILKCFLFGVVF